MHILSRRAAALSVVLLTLGALALRMAGIDAMLPHALEPDGQALKFQVEAIETSKPNPAEDPNWTYYPHLIAHIVALFPMSVHEGRELAEHLARVVSPYVRVRSVSVWLSLLTIPATYWLARRFIGRGTALLAAAFVATSLLALLIAPQARPHGGASALAVLAVVAALRLRHAPDLASYALAGLACGAAVASLQSGAATLLPLAVAHVLREHKRGARDHLRLLLSIAIVAAFVAAFYSFSPAVPKHMRDQEIEARPGVMLAAGHQIHVDAIDGSGFPVMFWTLLSFETIALILAALGLALAFIGTHRNAWIPPWRRQPDLAVALAYVVPYAIALGLYGRTVERFCLQLVPFTALLGAWCAERIARAIPALAARPALHWIAAAALLAPGALASIRFAALRSRPDTSTLAARWIETHVAPGEERVLLVPALELPLMPTAEALGRDASIGWGSPWVVYCRSAKLEAALATRFDIGHAPLLRGRDFAEAAADPMAYFRAAGVDFVAVPVPDVERGSPVARDVRDELARGARLVYQIPSRPSAAPIVTVGYDSVPATSHLIWTWLFLRGFEAVGRAIEIYDLRAPGR